MKNIDFLPESYRQRNELRRARLWWGICAGIFGGVIVLTMVTQWGIRRSVEQQLTLVEPLFLAAQTHDQKFVALQTNVSQQNETAALYIYLQHPWRRSQVLAALIQRLPQEVTLTAIDLKLESRPQTTTEPTSATRKRPTNDQAAEANKAKGKLPEQRDLAALREEYDKLNTNVEIRGTTSDDAALHAYVAQLSEHPLLASVRLHSIESMSVETDKIKKSRFVVQIQLKPGYGQPNGPEVLVPNGKPQTAKPAPVRNTNPNSDEVAANAVRSDEG